MRIEVCYALPQRTSLLAVEVPPGTSIREAIEQSGLLQRHPEIELSRFGVGVFGRARDPAEPVQAGDRIEIYRPLALDPREMRRRAARGK